MTFEGWSPRNDDVPISEPTKKIENLAINTDVDPWASLSDLESIINKASTTLEGLGVSKESVSIPNHLPVTEVWGKSFSFIQALDLATKYSDQAEKTKEKSLWEEVREYLKKKEFGKALMVALKMLFFGSNQLHFKAFEGDGFPRLNTNEMESIYQKDTNESSNTAINETKDKIATTDDVNQKLSYGFILTQLQDFFLAKKLRKDNPNKKLSDMDLLSPRLKVGSVICMRQQRETNNNSVVLWDAGMIHNDNETIADFTHTAIITSISPEPIITHATMSKWVHTQSLESYLTNFNHTNIVVMNPNDDSLGSAIASDCLSKVGMKYDKWAPVEQFLGDVDIKNKFNIKDDKTKTNCVEFIADALFSIDPQYTEIEDKSHPNDMLAIARKWYSMSYVKTYNRDRIEESVRAERMMNAMENSET